MPESFDRQYDVATALKWPIEVDISNSGLSKWSADVWLSDGTGIAGGGNTIPAALRALADYLEAWLVNESGIIGYERENISGSSKSDVEMCITKLKTIPKSVIDMLSF